MEEKQVFTKTEREILTNAFCLLDEVVDNTGDDPLVLHEWAYGEREGIEQTRDDLRWLLEGRNT